MQRILPPRSHLLLFSFLVLGLTLCLSLSPCLRANGPEIVLDGQLLASGDSTAEIREGRTFVPLRLLSEALGLAVEYRPSEQRIDLDRGRFSHVVGESFVTLANGERVDIGVPSYIREGRTMISLRLFAELLGCELRFDAALNRVSIQTPAPSSPAETPPGAFALQGAFLDAERSYPIQGEISIDDAGTELIFWALEDLHNMRIIALEYQPLAETETPASKPIGDEAIAADIVFVEAGQIASIEHLKKGAALIITDKPSDPASQPHTKIAYTTASGQEQAFLIGFSEEADELRQIAVPFSAVHTAKAQAPAPGPQLHVAEATSSFLAAHAEADILDEIVLAAKGSPYAFWTDRPLYDLQISLVQPSIDETSGLIIYEDRDVITDIELLPAKQLLILILETPEEIASLRFHYRIGSRNGSDESCLFAWIDEKAAAGLILDASSAP